MGGGGGGGLATFFVSGVSGQGGGRIIPGSGSETSSPWTYVTSAAVAGVTILADNRYNSTGNFRLFYESYGAPPSLTNGPGKGSEWLVFAYSSGGTAYLYARSGAGGGWGAQGGTASVAGAAAGKAINTVGNTVTWIGGSSRVYGVVG